MHNVQEKACNRLHNVHSPKSWRQSSLPEKKSKMNALKSTYRAMNAVMPSECFLADNMPVPTPADNLKKHLAGVAAETLDEIIEATGYAANGVAVGYDAQRDADINSAARRELARRLA
jgi:hypothetical protein